MKMELSPVKPGAVDEQELVKFCIHLYSDLIRDVADSLAISREESEVDIAYIANRVRNEGLPFLTVILPSVGKAFDKVLAHGVPFQDRCLQKRRETAHPALFGWAWERVIDSSGNEKPDSDSQAVRALRQLLYFLYKLERPWTPEQEESCLSAFEVTDRELPEPSEGYKNLPVDEGNALMHARNYITSVFSDFDYRDIIPKHGNGAVATGEENHEKHVFKRLYNSIERVYPYSEYFVYGQMQVADQYDSWHRLELLESGEAKVALVPKDSRGPRIISCEPLEYQWIQGGLGRAIRDHVEKHVLTRGQVNFTNQEVNRRLARLGSVSKTLVTLDMKEASDRVSLALVRELFRDVPGLLSAMEACRTTRTRLPNGKVVHMRKFAPMGSSLCFPVEAVVFHALAVGTLVHEHLKAEALKGRTPDYKGVLLTRKRYARRVFVYGDDIIAKREDYAHLLQYFPTWNLLFNVDKCCTAGSFRESCGMDAHKGVDVTPLRMKSVWCRRKYEPVTVESFVALSNAAEARSYYHVSDTLARHLNAYQELHGKPCIPYLSIVEANEMDFDDFKVEDWNAFNDFITYQHASQCGGWCFGRRATRIDEMLYSRTPTGEAVLHTRRWNQKLHRLEYKLITTVPRRISVRSDVWSMVLRRFTTPSRFGAPGSFALTYRNSCKYVWIPCPPSGVFWQF